MARPEQEPPAQARPGGAAGRLSAFGLALTADFPLPGAAPDAEADPVRPVILSDVEPGTLFPLTAEPRSLRHLQVYDGCPYATLQAPAGDILFHYGWRAMFHLSGDRRRLRCEFTAGGDTGSRRVLLDTVLWTVSLAHGLELLHAAAVRTPHGVVALAAASGGGKSSLAAEFLRRGAALFADDVVALEAGDDGVMAHPGPPVMNLPRDLASGPPPGATVLGEFGDELWVRLDRQRQAPGRLAAIVLVARTPGRALSCSRLAATSLTLLPLAISLPHVTSRQRQRFELFGRLAATTPVYALGADPAATPAQLADAVEREVTRG